MPHINHPAVKIENGRSDLPLKPNGKRWNFATAYEPSYCERMVALMAEGYSRAEVCKELLISPMAFDDWVKDFPDFKDAYAIGNELSKAWFSEKMRLTVIMTEEKDGPKVKFNDKTYVHTMATRFGISDKKPAITVNVNASDKDEELDRVKDLVKKLHEDTI